ncbi:thymidylate kinase [Geotalea uraniireducens]|uniref:Thymidylate kinase n=1 Tax=Geotalea uraniireducens TaxID=351604 RepID=A0ABM8EK35_9BACT|nr:dTMP kinase [Geotalea uraniireducens]BDV42570.1 thymidylate kinase [Geotalea uraniireducens]
MGFFITFEGIEGCGKTTQLRRVATALEKQGFPVVVTREPGGCPIADAIRGILLDAANGAMVPTTELLLYAAARAQHVAEVIAPALAAGKIVLCDRFTDSTIAYQGYGRNLDRQMIQQLNALAVDTLKPNLTLLLDCPVKIGLGRAMQRIAMLEQNKEERFEQESLLFHERVRDGFLALAVAEPERFVVLDGSRTVEETETVVTEAIAARLPRS